MQRQHTQDPVTFPYPGLPKASKGRCVERRAILTPVATPSRQAHRNDYQPPGEAVTIRSKHKIRQARRLRSLLKLVSKYAYDPPDHIAKQIHAEWKAVLNAKGYQRPFVDWLLKWPEIPFVSVQPPHEAELYDILQIVEYDANAAVLHEVSKRKEVAKFAEKLDVSEAYCQRKIQQVKGPQFPPVRQLTRWVTLNVTPMRIKAKGELRFRVLNFNAFDPSRSIYLDDKICQLIRVDGDTICIGQSGVSCDKVPVCIKQRHEICDERDLHSAFAKYWTQFWNRDDENDPHAWDSWSQHIDAFPMHQLIDSIDMRDIGYWKQTRSDIRHTPARGCVVGQCQTLSS